MEIAVFLGPISERSATSGIDIRMRRGEAAPVQRAEVLRAVDPVPVVELHPAGVTGVWQPGGYVPASSPTLENGAGLWHRAQKLAPLISGGYGTPFGQRLR